MHIYHLNAVCGDAAVFIYDMAGHRRLWYSGGYVYDRDQGSRYGQ